MPIISSPMTRANIPSLLERGIRKVYMDAYDLVDNEYEQIYNVTNSVKRQERDVITAGLGTFQLKTEGNAPFFDAGQEAWVKQYVHNTFALGTEITEEGMEDDLYDYYLSIGRELGKAAAYTRQVEAMDLFNNLGATLYTADGTAYTLLSTAHFRVDGGTWANRFTTPTDLQIESLEAALTLWRTEQKDQRGRKLAVRPAVLLVGPSDQWVAWRLTESDLRPGGSDNDVNVIKTKVGLKVMVSNFLADDGRWFLLAPKEQTGLVYFDRAPTEMRRRDDPRTGNLLMIGRYRESHGASHPWGIFGSPP